MEGFFFFVFECQLSVYACLICSSFRVSFFLSSLPLYKQKHGDDSNKETNQSILINTPIVFIKRFSRKFQQGNLPFAGIEFRGSMETMVIC